MAYDETLARKKIELKNSLDILERTEYFKTVIEEGFIKEYCLKAAHNFGNPALRQVEGVHNPSNILIAVSCLNHYLEQIRAEAESAEQELAMANNQSN